MRQSGVDYELMEVDKGDGVGQRLWYEEMEVWVVMREGMGQRVELIFLVVAGSRMVRELRCGASMHDASV